jgi:hypothetical protein
MRVEVRASSHYLASTLLYSLRLSHGSCPFFHHRVLTSGIVSSSAAGTEAEWADVGKRSIAYSGRFWLSESKDEPVLLHELSVCSIPKFLGGKGLDVFAKVHLADW